ncbi:transcriptional repressor [Cyclobacterium marinum]|uniref:Ferric uptake regulator, Fur family n=1 Tax=Cyclobacterium marinum (strain ATCC 25205 / DSM 745 / LMG 13164 / NCIMB 1802) TaxID=880070 RepID=G0J0C8_CYCMS|nr:transcriptional repressor [Cyclobacterium marinum]AEL28201.1 ferric uptake regulator, Fur family [Cyclobacterium marinum DSM 745]MBR9775653.1 transcriptional repressor [Cytophagales bacterium]|tara:strand:+ start:2826 stop:3281 length:456 start_codon:yes stop_codon:yes gene_type:complete
MSIPEDILKDHGIRSTDTRSKVIKYILRKKTACSLKELQQALAISSRQEKPINLTTFYRTINLFEQKGIVHRIDDGTGTVKFAILKPGSIDKKWHLHFHCKKCNNTFCLPETMPINLLSIGGDYHIIRVNLVLHGICEKCNGNYRNEKKHI